jgi:hypothetical protein
MHTPINRYGFCTQHAEAGKVDELLGIADGERATGSMRSVNVEEDVGEPWFSTKDYGCGTIRPISSISRELWVVSS